MSTISASLSEVAVATSASASPSLLMRIRQVMLVRRERRALLALDERMLADVGLSRADAYREANRSFLDVSMGMSRNSGR